MALFSSPVSSSSSSSSSNLPREQSALPGQSRDETEKGIMKIISMRATTDDDLAISFLSLGEHRGQLVYQGGSAAVYGGGGPTLPTGIALLVAYAGKYFRTRMN